MRRASACSSAASGRRVAGAGAGRGLDPQPLNGMSHGAAGFAYALASLAAATGRQEFADAASECIAFENSSYDAEHTNWPDFREGGAALALPMVPRRCRHRAGAHRA